MIKCFQQRSVTKVNWRPCISSLKYKAEIESAGFWKTSNLDRPVKAGSSLAVVDIRLLAGADAAVELGEQLAVDQLKDDHPRSWIHNLLDGRSVVFVLWPRSECQEKNKTAEVKAVNRTRYKPSKNCVTHFLETIADEQGQLHGW